MTTVTVCARCLCINEELGQQAEVVADCAGALRESASPANVALVIRMLESVERVLRNTAASQGARP